MDLITPCASLPALVSDRAACTPNAPFLAWADRVVTYASCAEESSRRASGLVRLGVRPGELILSLLSTRRDTIYTLLAASWAGAVLAPANRWLSPGALRALAAYINPDWVIADASSAHLLSRHRTVLPPPGRWIVLPGEENAMWTSAEYDRRTIAAPAAAPDDICYLDFTSGSTGTPKGVPRTHRSIHAISKSAIEGLGLRPQDRHLSLFASFAHPHEALARVALLGGTLVLVDSLRPSVIARSMARHRVTCIMAVPTIYALLSRRIQDPGFATLRLLESGGAMTPEPLIEKFRDGLGIPLTPVWGCTEAGGIALVGGSRDRPAGSAGRLCAGFQARLASEEPADSEREGELLLRGPSMAKEYFRLPAETARAFQDGWYYSGDIFLRDELGFYFFQGRTDEMLKVKGLKVFPSEIERVLLAHPLVAEAAVVAGDGDDRLVAFVVSAPGEPLTESELRAFCRQRLEPFKVPRMLLRPSLPKTRSGKILKRALAPHGSRPPIG